MYFIQHLLLNLKLIQQISQIFSYIKFITKFNCTFKNTVNTKILDKYIMNSMSIMFLMMIQYNNNNFI